jgi:O-antigen ligase
MFVAAFGSLPRRIDFGLLSGMGALTIVEVGMAGVGLLACHRYPKSLLLRTLPCLCFIAWIGLSVIWAPPRMGGMQNALVYILFGAMVLFGGTLTARNDWQIERLIDRGMLWISSVGLSLVAVELVLHGLPRDLEEGWWIGPRPLAILGLVVLSRYLARWYYGDKRARIWIVLWIAAIVMSISRAATATSLALVCVMVLAQMRFRRRRVAITLPVALGAVILVITLALTWTPFYERMFTGDAVKVGQTSINVSGRVAMWTAVIESAREEPLIGKGLGSAQEVVGETFAHTRGQMLQPHDDYLRIWHDLGAIGLALFLAAGVVWMWLLGRRWYQAERTSRRGASLELTAFLTLLALSVVAFTDNPIVYQSVMGPAGLLVGAGLGARSYRRSGDNRISPAMASAPNQALSPS